MNTNSNTPNVDLFPVAAIQMVSSANVTENLKQAAELIRQAAQAGAGLIALPEYFCFMGETDRDKLAIKEEPGQGLIQDFLSRQAALHGVWLAGGTLPLACPEPERVFNSTFVYAPDGRPIARYDKIHLFSFKKDAESYDESIAICPGDQVQAFDAPCGRVGLSICYDLRFPEIYRAMGPLNLILVPAAFTYTTGAAHWELLLRVRAIENQCYVLAPAQGGRHVNGRRTWGHSMLIDPWGEIIHVLPEGPGVVSGNIALQRIAEVRRALPALRHRVM